MKAAKEENDDETPWAVMPMIMTWVRCGVNPEVSTAV